jgi:Zn finger protein HypA/HybF involved in hydrogenase expression
MSVEPGIDSAWLRPCIEKDMPIECKSCGYGFFISTQSPNFLTCYTICPECKEENAYSVFKGMEVTDP